MMASRKSPTPIEPEELAVAFAKLRDSERVSRVGRPIFGEQVTKTFCVKMPSEMAVRLVAWAKKESVSPQEILRRLLEAALEEPMKE